MGVLTELERPSSAPPIPNKTDQVAGTQGATGRASVDRVPERVGGAQTGTSHQSTEQHTFRLGNRDTARYVQELQRSPATEEPKSEPTTQIPTNPMTRLAMLGALVRMLPTGSNATKAGLYDRLG
jgi:hypothetical protein